MPLQDGAGEPTLFLGADAWDNPTLLDNDEAAIDGSFFSSHFSPDTNEPSARAFVDTCFSFFAVPLQSGFPG